ncbi:MAG: TadE family protein [Beijerinckiaceae bacterium]|jgi:Flp pilus assembly protein TadG
MNVHLQTITATLQQKIAAFAAARNAIAAVEFAIIFPVLVIFMLGGGEAARFVNASRQLTNLAYSEANLVAERPVGYATMTSNDIIFVQQATPVIFPEILKDAARQSTTWSADQNFLFTISSVIFTPTVTGCTSSCTYKGAVAWSLYQGGLSTATVASKLRSCSVAPVSAPDSQEPSLTTLPTDVFTSGSLIVVDLAYTYTPVFGSSFFHSVTLHRSAYLQPRYLPHINYSGTLQC